MYQTQHAILEDIPERFAIQRQLGSGGFGAVYLAFDRELEATVALKVLMHATPTSLLRFKREFRSLSTLAHPNLVKLYELHNQGDLWYFTMEFIQGITFLHHVTRTAHTPKRASVHVTMTPDSQSDSVDFFDQPTAHVEAPDSMSLAQGVAPVPAMARDLDVERLCEVMAQLVQGVLALHQAQKLHRDLKPSNVMIGEDGRVILLDFGLIYDEDTLESNDALRPEGSVNYVGTPHYMSPEQAAGMALSEASDWYSVGVMLYIALTGQFPVNGNSHLQLLIRKQSMVPPHVLDFNPQAPPELARACMALLARDPQARAGATQLLDAIGQTSRGEVLERIPAALSDGKQRSSFVGRELELKRLKDTLGQLRERKTSSIARVHGPSGIGKSALVRRFLRHASRQPDVLVWHTRCYENETVPFKAFDGLIDHLAQHLWAMDDANLERLIPEHVGPLLRVFPSLLSVPGLSKRASEQDKGLDSGQVVMLRNQAFDALASLLKSVGLHHALVLSIEDAQWADSDSALMLQRLWSHDLGLMMILSHRPEAQNHPFLDALEQTGQALEQRGGLHVVLELGVLSHEESIQIVEDLLGSHATQSGHIERLIQDAAGNPFFIDEFTRYARLHPDALAQGKSQRLEDIIQQRVDALPDEAQQLLKMVSLAAHPLTMPQALTAMAPMRDHVQDAIVTLRSHRLLRVRTQGGDRLFETYHDRIRETLTQRMPSAQRVANHARLADALERDGADSQHTAYHCVEANQYERALPHLRASAQHAEETLAFEQAASAYEQMLELGHWEREQRASLHERAGRLRGWIGHGLRAADHYQEAARHSSGNQTGAHLSVAANQLIRVGRYEEGLSLLTQLLDDIQVKLPTSDVAIIGGIVKRRIALKLRGMHVDTSSPVSPEARRRLDLYWATSQGVGCFDLKMGAYVSLIHLIQALELGDARHVTLALATEGIFQGSKQSTRLEGAQLLERARSFVSQSDDAFFSESILRFAQGMLHYMSDDFDPAVECMTQTIEAILAQRADMVWELDGLYFYRLLIHFERGDLVPFKQELPDHLQETLERQDAHYSDAYTIWSHLTHLANDDPDAAQAALDAMVPGLLADKHFRLHHFWAWQAIIHTKLYQGDPVGAWQASEVLQQRVKRSQITRALDSAAQTFHYLLCRLCIAQAAASGGKWFKLAKAQLKQLRRVPGPLARATALSAQVQIQWLSTGTLDAAAAQRALDALSQAGAQLHHHALALGLAASRQEDLKPHEQAMRALGVEEPGRMAQVLVPAFHVPWS